MIRGLISRKLFVGDAEPFAHAESRVVEHDVGLRDQLEEHLLRVGVLQVEDESPLSPVVDTEAGAVRAKRIPARGLDLHDIGTEVGQHGPGVRTRDHGAEIQHLHTRERRFVNDGSVTHGSRGARRDR